MISLGIEINFMQDVMKEGNYENATYTKNWNVAKDICTMDQKIAFQQFKL